MYLIMYMCMYVVMGGAWVTGYVCIIIAFISFIDRLVFLQSANDGFWVVHFLWNQDCEDFSQVVEAAQQTKNI